MSADASLVAVVAQQGSGKTTPIKLANGSSSVEVAPTEPFSINGKQVALLDKPGFDNKKTSDFDSLEEMAQCMTKTCEKGKPLHGIRYLQNNTATEMGGIAAHNMGLFDPLCGEDPFESAAVVTTMWGELPRAELGDAREKELKEDVDSVGPILEMGAALITHKDTTQSSHSILSLLLVAIERRGILTKLLNDILWREPVSAASVLTRDIDAKEEECVQDDDSEMFTLQDSTKIHRYDGIQESAKSSVPSSHPVRASKQLVCHFAPPIQIQITQYYQLIMFIGQTSAGKTIFISLATRSSLKADSDTRSYNKEVISTVPSSPDAQELNLINISGLYDTGTSGLDIVWRIVQYLVKAYERKPLEWVPYSHKTTVRRMRGTAIRNSRLFKNISGDDPLKSAVTAPNVWQSSPSMALGIVRPEMAKGPDFFTRVTHAPSMIHANTRGSSSSILSLLLVEDRREILVRIGSDKPWLEQTLAASMGSPLLDTKKKSMERSACMESAPENSARFQTTLNAAFSSLPAHVTTHSTHHSGSSIQIQNTHFTTQEAPIVSHIPTRKAREDRDFKAPDLGDVAGIQRGDEEEESAMRVIRSPPPAQATTGSTRYSSSPSRMQDPEGGYLIARDESVKAKDSGTLTLEDGGNIQRHDVTKKFARGAILSSAPKQNTTPPMHRSGTASQAQDIQSYHLIGVGRPMTSIGFTAPVLEGDTRVQIHDNMTETAKRIIPSSIQLKARTQSTSLLSPPIQMGDTPNYHPTVATEPMKGEDFWKAALKEIYQHDGAKESAEYIVPSSAPAQDTTQPTDRSGSPSRTQSTQSYYLIAVIGPTGSGKSSFINLASGSKLGVGEGLRPCTKELMPTMAFSVKGRQVVLLDTPGFDDWEHEYDEILEKIEQYLVKPNKEKKRLDGILYFQSILDRKAAKTTDHNLKTLRKLCGDGSFKSVAVVTTMWEMLSSPKIGEEREKELKSDKDFFGHVLDGGATLMRHNHTEASSHRIISEILIPSDKGSKHGTQTETDVERHRPEEVNVVEKLIEDMDATIRSLNRKIEREERAMTSLPPRECKQKEQEIREMKRQIKELEAFKRKIKKNSSLSLSLKLLSWFRPRFFRDAY